MMGLWGHRVMGSMGSWGQRKNHSPSLSSVGLVFDDVMDKNRSTLGMRLRSPMLVGEVMDWSEEELLRMDLLLRDRIILPPRKSGDPIRSEMV